MRRFRTLITEDWLTGLLFLAGLLVWSVVFDQAGFLDTAVRTREVAWP